MSFPGLLSKMSLCVPLYLHAFCFEGGSWPHVVCRAVGLGGAKDSEVFTVAPRTCKELAERALKKSCGVCFGLVWQLGRRPCSVYKIEGLAYCSFRGVYVRDIGYPKC